MGSQRASLRRLSRCLCRSSCYCPETHQSASFAFTMVSKVPHRDDASSIPLNALPLILSNRYDVCHARQLQASAIMAPQSALPPWAALEGCWRSSIFFPRRCPNGCSSFVVSTQSGGQASAYTYENRLENRLMRKFLFIVRHSTEPQSRPSPEEMQALGANGTRGCRSTASRSCPAAMV